PGRHPPQHHVHLSGRPRIRGGRRGADREVAVDALHDETVATDRFQVSAARDENHVLTGLGQPSAEIAADSPRPEHHDPHPGFPSRAGPGPVYALPSLRDNIWFLTSGTPC